MGAEEIYNDKQYCFKELGIARKMFTSSDILIPEKVEAIEKALGLMYLYCPDDISELVLSQLDELERRQSMLLI